jgi:phosphoribosylanthranilate isomerase
MSRLVKICGINAPAAFDAAVAAGADYLGFVFYPPSPRYVTAQVAAALSARAVGGPRRVGLFVAPALDEVRAVLDAVRLDAVQVYAPAAAIAALRAALPVPVWRQAGIATADDLPGADEADGFVLEAKPPAGATRPGGNAVLADWAMLSRFNTARPWLVAGGLTAGNVGEALARTGAPGADVSSGVETAPGVKDAGLIAAFCAAVRKIPALDGGGAGVVGDAALTHPTA